MKNFTRILAGSGALVAVTCISQGFAGGFVSPKSIKMVITRATLTTVEDKDMSVFETTAEHTFSADQTDLAASKLGSIVVPEGRYKSVRVCYQRVRKIVVDGATYYGDTTGSLTDQAALYTSGTGTDLAVQTAVPATGATEVSFGSTEETCATSYFDAPVCVARSSGSCPAGDTVAPTPDLFLTLNMSLAVRIDSQLMKVSEASAIYPIPSIGKPGAAVVLTRRNAGINAGVISLLFTSDKKLQFSQGDYDGTAVISGFCSGQGYAETDGGTQLKPVQKYDAASGKVQYSANQGSTEHHGAPSQGGMMTIANINQVTPGATTDVTCVADSAADPAYLGKTYTGGPGATATTAESWTIQKIVDPSKSVFGAVCPSGNCGTTP